MFKHLLIAGMIVAGLAPAPQAFAQQRDVATRSALSASQLSRPIAAAIEQVQFDARDHRRTTTDAGRATTSAAQSQRRGSVWGRVLLAGIGGTMGFYSGGVIGARIEGPCGGCDDPGLKGALIGAPIGAVVGAIAGWKIAGLLD